MTRSLAQVKMRAVVGMGAYVVKLGSALGSG
jgi:hypothetical protein